MRPCLKRIQRMPNIPLAYVSVYRRMSDIFHTLTYACTIRNSVTGPLRPFHTFAYMSETYEKRMKINEIILIRTKIL
jgi:hypothetical protein